MKPRPVIPDILRVALFRTIAGVGPPDCVACAVPLFVLSIAGDACRFTQIKRRHQWKDDIANKLNDSWVAATANGWPHEIIEKLRRTGAVT